MNYASSKEQVSIYFGKFRRSFQYSKGWYSFLSTLIIAVVACLVSGKNGFNSDFWTGNSAIAQTSFILACSCIWIGLFNSITVICKERDIIKHEYRSGMKLSSYIVAHLIFQALISLLEAIIIMTVVFLFYGSKISELSRFGDLSLLRFFSYFLTFFLIIYASDVLGILLSSIVKNTEQAMTIMPFFILLQFLFSGQIQLEGTLAFLTNGMVSRFGLDALLYLANATNSISDNPHNIFICWIALIVFSLFYAYLSVKILKSVEKDQRGTK
ncbi:ABC transporter permease [Streptococcus suis]|uniref:ABC transporter permease n=1 Tax=Streptococcus suis TaxID=1307 RepID=UPI003F8C1DD9